MVRHALVIGIPQYDQYLAFPPIRQAPPSAEQVAKILEKEGNFQVERLPKKPEKDEMSGNGVTYAQFNDTLGTFLQKASNEDALIYFIGHGFTLQRKLGLGEKKEGFLATSDCQVEVQNERVINQARGFPLSDFNELINKYTFNSLIVVFDSCYSGLLFESIKSALIENFTSNNNYYLLAACRDFETAKVLSDDQYSVFSGLLIKGLAQENADRNGEISNDLLFDFVCREVKRIQEENKLDKLQSPSRLGLGERIVLVKYNQILSTQKEAVRKDGRGEILCPYQGLQPFEKEQEIFFFGRNKQVKEIFYKLNKKPFVAVIGASGSGKSSVVRAGLIPRLNKDSDLIFRFQEDSKWQSIDSMKPGSNPLANLVNNFNKVFSNPKELHELNRTTKNIADSWVSIIKSLRSSVNYLLLIDQFEELFTVCTDETERSQFIELIIKLANIPDSRLAIIITMRADFIESCLRYPSLTQIIQAQAIYMPPLVGKDLSDAIEKPASIQGYNFEEGLLEEILQDVANEKGILPLLEFALTQLWEKRDSQNHQLTLAQYKALGGVTGALNLHADKIYSYKDFGEESPQQQRLDQEKKWIEQIFLRLVQIDERGKDTRQRQRKVDLLDIAGNKSEEREALNQVLEDLVRGRLLVTGEGGQKIDDQNENPLAHSAEQTQVIDLAHEALIRDWRRLKDWVEDNRIDLKFRQSITQAASEWENNAKKEEYLVHLGSRLEAAKVLAQKGFLSPFEVEYVAACAEKVDRELNAKVEQERKLREEAEQRTRLANSRTRLAIASSILLLFSGFGVLQWRSADRSQIEARVTSSKRTFDSNRDTLDALSEALKAGKQLQQSIWVRNNSTLRAEVMEVLAQATYWVRERNSWEAHNTYVNSVSISPDPQPQDQIIATGADDGIVKLWHRDGTEIKTKTQLKHRESVFAVTFSPDGQILASASNDGVVKLWKRDGTFLRDLKVSKNENPIPVWSVTFSPDGQTIAAANGDGTIILWDRQGNLRNSWKKQTNPIYSISFSPDGKTIAATDNNTVKLWNREGKPVRSPLIGHKQPVVQVRFSPDGQTIATASADTTAILWDSKTGAKKFPLAGHTRGVLDVVFSPDGKTVATASTDSTIKLWNRNGELLSTLEGHNNRVNSLSFNKAGTLIASASYDNTVKLWQPNYSYLIPIKHRNRVSVVNFTRYSQKPDSHKLITVDVDNNVSLWKPNGDLLKTWRENSAVYDVSFSQDSKIVAAAKGDGTVTLRNLEGKLLTILSKHNGLVTSVDFSPDGKTIATAGYDPLVKFWNLKGQLQDTLNTDEKRVYSVRFNPDSSTIATTSADGTAKLWNQDKTFRILLKGHEPDSPIFQVSFSPDSRLLATASKDNTAILWNKNGKLLHTLKGHTAAVLTVDFQPGNSQTLATASDDRTVKLWDQDGKLITTLVGHRNFVNRVRFSPDGKVLATAGGDNIAILWKDMDHLTLDGLMKRGCSWMQDYRKTHADELPNVCDGINP